LRALGCGGAASSAERDEWVKEIAVFVANVKNFEPRQFNDGLDFGVIVQELAKQAPSDTIICEDAGNFSSWVHRIWPFDGKNPALGAIGGAMGLAVPAAVAASLRYPGRMVIAFAGDGGAMMTGNELATAMQHGLPIKFVISNNQSYGTIRLHQERDHPHRTMATKLTNPDFAAWATSFGALGLTIQAGDDVAPIVAEFLAHQGAAVLEVRASLEAINAFTTINHLRAGR
jgi:Thiamine pyrophosphate-requiring enzymes [acetolactate synthase, pyruvate dehydrogenase (cytochrome), glyoxylate carboligase, phosphonopyruvate decarboxylase]